MKANVDEVGTALWLAAARRRAAGLWRRRRVEGGRDLFVLDVDEDELQGEGLDRERDPRPLSTPFDGGPFEHTDGRLGRDNGICTRFRVWPV